MKLKYSWIYCREFKKKVDLDRLKDNTGEFRELFEKYKNKIIKLIEKHSKKKLNKNLNVYIVERDKGSSFHAPLTLKFHKNNKLMFVIFIHELVHHVVDESFGGRREYNVNKIVRKVIKELDIDLEKEFKIIEGFAKEKYKDYEKR